MQHRCRARWASPAVDSCHHGREALGNSPRRPEETVPGGELRLGRVGPHLPSSRDAVNVPRSTGNIRCAHSPTTSASAGTHFDDGGGNGHGRMRFDVKPIWSDDESVAEPSSRQMQHSPRSPETWSFNVRRCHHLVRRGAAPVDGPAHVHGDARFRRCSRTGLDAATRVKAVPDPRGGRRQAHVSLGEPLVSRGIYRC